MAGPMAIDRPGVYSVLSSRDFKARSRKTSLGRQDPRHKEEGHAVASHCHCG